MSKTAVAIANQAGAFLMQLSTMLWVARLLGAEGQGKFALVRGAVYICEPIMWFGLTTGTTYLVARQPAKYHDALLTASLAYLGLLAVVGVSAILSVPVTALPEMLRQQPLSMGLGVLSWLISLAGVQLFCKIFIGQQRFGVLSATTYMQVLGTAVALALIVVTRSSFSFVSAIWANAVGNSIALMLAAIAHRRSWKLTTLADTIAVLPDAYTVGLKGYLSAGLFVTLYRADFFFVGHFLGPSQLGVYAVAVFVIEATQKLPDWLGMTLTPRVAASPRGVPFAKYLSTSLIAVSGQLAVFTLMVWVLGSGTLGTFLGREFEPSEKVIFYLFPRALLHAAMVIYAAYLAGRGYTYFHPLSGALALITLVGADFYLIPRFGLVGAAFGIALAYVVATVIMIWGAATSRTNDERFLAPTWLTAD